MPINYPQTPFRPADPAGAYAKGYGLGLHSGQAQAQIAMQRAALAQKAQQDAIEVVVKQQQFEREATLAGQRLEVEKAYKMQQNSLAGQELQMKQQEMQEKIKQAADQTLRGEMFRRYMSQPGADPIAGTFQHLAGPGYEGNISSALSASRDKQASFTTLLEDYNSAVKGGANKETIDFYKAKIAKDIAPPGMTVEYSPTGGFKLTQGGGGGATTAMQTQGQEKLVQYENALEAIHALQKSLTPGDVGIRGKLGEVVVDETLAQFLPGAAVGERIDARAAARTLRATLLNVITSDSGGRSSAQERKELADALPDVGMLESYDTVMGKLGRMRTDITNRGKVYSRSIGKEAPLWSMSPEEIKSLYQQKSISYDQAADVLKRFYK